MENILGYVSSALLVAGGWNLANGILYDVFVLRLGHGKQYDRNPLRLLMYGHILFTCGIILLIAGNGARSQATLLSMIGYCFMMFPFLKSTLTLVINSLALII